MAAFNWTLDQLHKCEHLTLLCTFFMFLLVYIFQFHGAQVSSTSYFMTQIFLYSISWSFWVISHPIFSPHLILCTHTLLYEPSSSSCLCAGSVCHYHISCFCCFYRPYCELFIIHYRTEDKYCLLNCFIACDGIFSGLQLRSIASRQVGPAEQVRLHEIFFFLLFSADKLVM